MDTTTDWTGRKVAIYWDQENVVAGYFEAIHGRNTWREALKKTDCTEERQTRFRQARIDMDAIMSALEPAAVMINRAYGNWAAPWLRTYAPNIQRHAIDAIQMFPTTGTKNGADIRLALDVANDLLNYPPITDVVVIGGDSDYIALAQHCQRHQRRFTNITVRGASSRHLQSAADETIWYEDLVPAPVEPHVGTPVPTAATDLLLEAVSQLMASSSTGWAVSAQIRPRMRQIDPTFTLPEGETIRGLLDQHEGSRLEIRCGTYDREVRLLNEQATAVPEQPAASAPTAAPHPRIESLFPALWDTHAMLALPPAPEKPLATVGGE